MRIKWTLSAERREDQHHPAWPPPTSPHPPTPHPPPSLPAREADTKIVPRCGGMRHSAGKGQTSVAFFGGKKSKEKFEREKKWAWPMGVARRWSAPTDKKKREQRLFFQFKEKISSIAFF